MGKGFAFVDRQYHLVVDGDDYYIDILMYHLKLHCYVVVELKAVEFIPEFVSKLNFYISAVDEYDSEGRAEFFTKVFRVYSGGVFAVASALILFCQLFTKILVAPSYYDSWKYVPILIIATTYSCIVNFMASVYMAEKKSTMSLVTAMSGAVTNFVLNLVLIPKIGANGAAVATVCAFLVVFVTRGTNIRKYIKIDYKLPVMLAETAVLILQSCLMLYMQKGVILYVIESVLLCVMLLINFKPIKELLTLLLGKFLKRGKKQ